MNVDFSAVDWPGTSSKLNSEGGIDAASVAAERWAVVAKAAPARVDNVE